MKGKGLAACSAFGVTLCLFLSTASPVPRWGDGPEVAIAGQCLGICHPPGYPLQALILGLPRLIAEKSSWGCSGASSALFGSFSVLCAFLMARQFTRRTWASLAAALLWALTLPFWTSAASLEVTSLHTALTAAFLLSSISNVRASALVFGMLLASHPVSSLWLPLILRKIKGRGGATLASQSIALAIVGGSLLLFLPIRAAAPASWNYRHPDTFQSFIKHVTISDEVSERATRPSLERLQCVYREFRTPLWPVADLLMGLGVLASLRRRPGDSVCLLLPGLVSVAFLSMYPQKEGGTFLLSNMPVAVCFAAEGLARIDAWTGLLARHRQKMARGILAVGCFSWVLSSAPSNWEALRAMKTRLPVRYGRDLMSSLEEGTLVVTSRSDLFFLMEYVRRWEGYRSDVTPVFFHLLPFRWYQEELRSRAQLEIGSEAAVTGDLWVARQGLLFQAMRSAGTRPIALTGLIPVAGDGGRQIRQAYRFLPWGMVFKILPIDESSLVPRLPDLQWNEAMWQELRADSLSRMQYRITFLAMKEGCASLGLNEVAEAYRRMEISMTMLASERSSK